MQRLAALCRIQNPHVLKRNFEQMTSHLAQIIASNVVDIDTFRGKTLRLNLRVGHLVIYNGTLTFEGIPFHVMLQESKEQQDDQVSKMSSMSMLNGLISNHRSSKSLVKKEH